MKLKIRYSVKGEDGGDGGACKGAWAVFLSTAAVVAVACSSSSDM